MADVDMTDAPVERKKVVKSGDADSKGEKKRFEVKKVRESIQLPSFHAMLTDRSTVECRCPLGLGYRRRQLRHLP